MDYHLQALRYSLSTIAWDHLTQSLVLLFIALSISALFYFLLKQKEFSKRQRRLLKYRISYVAITCYVILLGRIWVEGFLHILTVVSLVAAGLVVVNKESVMNLVGSLIINWRNLFAEGDYVQFNQYRGYVCSLGVFYFTLQVSNSESIAEPTGKVVKIPNGILITNPIINYSANGGVLHEELQIIFENTSDVDHLKKVIYDTTIAVLTPFKTRYVSTNNLSRIATQDPLVVIKLQTEKPYGILALVTFYCFFKDAEEIKTTLYEALIKHFQKDTKAYLIRPGS